VFDFAHPEDHEMIKKRLPEIVKGKEMPQSEQRIIDMDGEVKNVVTHSVYIKYEGRDSVQTVMTDITQAAQREKALEESRQRFKSLFDQNPNAVYSFDLEGNFIMANEELVNLLGFSKEELNQMSFEPLVHPDDRKRVWEKFLKAASGDAQRYEARGIHKEGHLVYVAVTNLPIYVDGEIIGVFGIAQDITRQKEMARELKKSEQRWQHLVENNPQPVQVTVDGEIVFINEAGAQLYGAETEEEVTGMSVFEFSHPDYVEKIRERKHNLENNFDVENTHEHKILRLDDELRYIEVHSIPIRYQGQKAIQTVLHDITDRKEKEKIIERSLKEKEILLKEIHHRVKNNMAVVSGMIELQAMSTENEELEEVLKESQLRIFSMAMIHEKLYQTDTLSDIGFDSYIKELVETIQKTVDTSGKMIHIEYQLDDISLNVNQAIPAALILNELIVNVFKHAFEGREKGEVVIKLDERKGKIKLSVIDNGIGLPDNFEPEEMDSLGMTLVSTLAKQLKATLQVEADDPSGSIFSITFEKQD